MKKSNTIPIEISERSLNFLIKIMNIYELKDLNEAAIYCINYTHHKYNEYGI